MCTLSDDVNFTFFLWSHATYQRWAEGLSVAVMARYAAEQRVDMTGQWLVPLINGRLV